MAADVQAETDDTPVAEPPLEAPQHWPADERVRFANLPREMQEWFLNRVKNAEADYTRRSQEIATKEKQYGEFDSILKPIQTKLELAGMTPAQAIRQLLAAQTMLETNPAQGLSYLARTYGVDLKNLVAPETPEDTYVDPTVKALKDELNAVKAQLNGWQQQATQTREAEAQRVISDFKATKAEDGSPKYPYFDQIQHLMAPLVAQGKSLEEAYDAAKYTLPEVRERIADEARKAAQAEALKKVEEERRQKAAKARTASQTIRTRSAPAQAPDAKPGTLRDELARNLAAALSTGTI